MQNNKTSLAMLPLVAACITAQALATLLAAGLMQGERISRPVISEQTSPLDRSLLSPEMAIVATGFFANLQGSGPFRSS